MSDARHTPPGDTSFASSLVRHVVAGLGLIVVVAAAFWLIGQVRTPDQGNPVISAPTEQATQETEAPTGPDETPSATPASPTGATPTPTVTQTPTVSPSPTETEDGTRSSISVQVLDATGGDGDAMAAAIEDLRELGYQVVASSRAVRTYERSTLFFTEGHRDDAVQIQQDLPEFGVIEEKPDNLSDTVDVHVIVGLDHPDA